MVGAGKDVVAERQLVDPTESLESRLVDKPELKRVEFDEAEHRRPDRSSPRRPAGLASNQ
jgi:hypothetical protein